MALNNYMEPVKKAYLILADGTVYEGRSFGAEGTTIGEVVFTTGMTGYQETLTDPGYYGQIVTQTFPLVGNYGINDTDEESGKVWMRGYIVRDWCETPSNFRSNRNIDNYLVEKDIIGLYGIDTRALTRKIRNDGVMNGAITTDYPGTEEEMQSLLSTIRGYKVERAVPAVSCKGQTAYNVAHPSCKVAMFDYGFKRHTLRGLNNKGCSVMVVPWDTGLAQIEQMGVDGVFFSNGPGNPAENPEIIANIREILEKTDLPAFGICLGHQLMALAMGAETEKMKYGHRGGNQPVLDKEFNKVYVTTQNHGYCVKEGSLPEGVGTVSHVNANDQSCEGIIYERPRTFSVQFHPDTGAGPEDSQYLFDRFVENMLAYKKEKQEAVSETGKEEK